MEDQRLMVKIIVMTHGDMAKGIIHSAKMLIGEMENVDYLSLDEDMGSEELDEKLGEKLSEAGKEAQHIILCDIIGGTPFNVASKYSFKNENIAVYYGLNLPLLIETIMKANDCTLDEIVEYLGSIEKSTIGLSEI